MRERTVASSSTFSCGTDTVRGRANAYIGALAIPAARELISSVFPEPGCPETRTLYGRIRSTPGLTTPNMLGNERPPEGGITRSRHTTSRAAGKYSGQTEGVPGTPHARLGTYPQEKAPVRAIRELGSKYGPLPPRALTTPPLT